MSANSVKLFVVFSVILFFVGCKDKDVAFAKNKEKILIERETYTLEVYNNKIKELEAKFEKVNKEFEKVNREKEDMAKKLDALEKELKKKSETASPSFGSFLGDYNENYETRQMRGEFEERIKSLAQESQASKQKTEALEKKNQELSQEMDKIKKERIQYQRNQQAINQFSTSFLDDNIRGVPVKIEILGSNSSDRYPFVRIINKKTRNFFIYELNDRSSNYVYGSTDLIYFIKTITLIPGEYTIEVSKNESSFSAPKDFTVLVNPFIEINETKYHAVVRQ